MQILVSDMDETLVHCMGTLSADEKSVLMSIPGIQQRLFTIYVTDVQMPRGTGYVQEMTCIERPHLDRFLRYADSRFRYVIVWSAGVREYVDATVAGFTVGRPRPAKVWARDKCTGENLLKPLSLLEGVVPGMNLKNTFIIDDRESAFSLSNMQNGILVEAFAPTVNDLAHQFLKGGSEDVELLRLIDYFELERVCVSTDIRLLKHSFEHTTSSILHAQCLFTELATAIRNSPSAASAMYMTLSVKYETDPTFRQLVRRCGDDALRPSAQTVRALLLAVYTSSPHLADEHWKEVCNQSWARSAARGECGYDLSHFLRLLGDHDAFAGDRRAAATLAQLLHINVVINGPDGNEISRTTATHALASLQLVTASDGRFRAMDINNDPLRARRVVSEKGK